MARRSHETEREHRPMPSPGKGGLKSVGVNIHRATGSKGGPTSPQQGGTQYKEPVVKSGSLRSTTPGKGEGRGSPFVHHKR